MLYVKQTICIANFVSQIFFLYTVPLFIIICLYLAPVTEVIWEGEETEAKKADSSMTKKTDNFALSNTVSRLLLCFIFSIYV